MHAMPHKLCVLLAMSLTLTINLPAQEPAATPSVNIFVTPDEAHEHLLKRVEPVYPSFAQMTRIEGMIDLQVAIDENGKATAKLISGHPMLAPAAAAPRWRLKPSSKE